MELRAEEQASDPLASIRHLPASNPYRAPLEKLLTLPREDQEALRAWAYP
jgi:hypothetical protein